VEPDQGNGEKIALIQYTNLQLIVGGECSAFTHHLAIEARCGSESGCAANLYLGA
jgi:hypothetical protein